MTRAKKLGISAAVLLAAVVVTGVALFARDKSNFSAPEQFEIADGTPYCVKDGDLYRYEGGGWSEAEHPEQVRQLVSCDLALCTVDKNGTVFYDGELPDPMEIRSLGSAAAFDMAHHLMELNSSTSLVGLSGDIVHWPSALAEDGTIFLPAPALSYYERYTMKERPIELSDEFVLTEQGNVYSLAVKEFTAEPVLRCIYDGGDITSISAAYGTRQCLGLKEDGTVLFWNESGIKNFDIPSVEEWTNVRSVKQGFHFAVGLTGKGEVLYADNSEGNTEKIGGQLKAWGKIEAIAIYGMTVFGLKPDGSCVSMEVDLV